MRFMLDTNACIAVMNRRPVEVSTRLTSLNVGDICVSSLAVAELRFGAEKSTARARNHAAINELLDPISVMLFDEAAAAVSGLIRANLQRLGRPIGLMDALIGAHSLSLGLTLVTSNTREFQRIEGLKVEDWSLS